MKFLLDTHTFIWWNSRSAKLSERASQICGDLNNNLLLSVASAWEIQIKLQLGKLTLNGSLDEIIREQQNINNIEIMPITLNHVLTLNFLPLYHKDPFDRLLIAQAIVEDAIIISCDSVFANYPVRIEW